jgi:hypothetical protein
MTFSAKAGALKAVCKIKRAALAIGLPPFIVIGLSAGAINFGKLRIMELRAAAMRAPALSPHAAQQTMK